MQPFPSEGTSDLEWLQPRSLEHYFELRSKDALVATLGWESMLSHLARVETAHGTWTLELIGILNQHVEVREADTQLLVGDYYPGLMGNGVLELADGRKLKWESTNFWGTDWAFFDEAGHQPVALKEGVEKATWRDMLKTQYTVLVDQAEYTPDQLVLLAALGVYLIVWQRLTVGAVGATAAMAG